VVVRTMRNVRRGLVRERYAANLRRRDWRGREEPRVVSWEEASGGMISSGEGVLGVSTYLVIRRGAEEIEAVVDCFLRSSGIDLVLEVKKLPLFQDLIGKAASVCVSRTYDRKHLVHIDDAVGLLAVRSIETS